MATKLEIKKGRGVPKDAEMAEAELALDLDDGTLYSKLGDGLVHALNEAPDADNYGHWKLQVDYGTPYEVESGRTANFEGKGGVDVSLAGDTVTVDGSGIVANLDADNYQYWQYKVNGFSTTDVLSTQVLDFQSGNGIQIDKEGYGIKISATDTGGGASVHIGENEPADPQEGQQWMEVPADGDATMWIYDGDKWLQQPGGKDGAAGADGNIANGSTDGIVATWDSTANSGAGQWTPDSSLTIDESGNATFSGTLAASGGLKTWLWVHGNNDQIGVTINASENRLVPYGDSKNVMDLGATSARFKDAYFSGVVSASGAVVDRGIYRPGATGSGIRLSNQNSILPSDGTGAQQNDLISLGDFSSKFKDGWFSGNLYKNGSTSPLINGTDIIKTLTTLRNATKDETTLEGLRDSIGNAIGGLIEEFENQIAEMPAEDEA
jgi:hypothetical protein